MEATSCGASARIAKARSGKVAHRSILGVGAAWRKPGTAIPVRASDLDQLALSPLSIGSLTVASEEYVSYAVEDDSAADALADALRVAIVRELDRVFCSDAAPVADTSPGVAYDAQTVTSTGTKQAQIGRACDQWSSA